MLSQEEKLALRLKQAIQNKGLVEVCIFVNQEGEIVFWKVKNEAVEGEKLADSASPEKSVV